MYLEKKFPHLAGETDPRIRRTLTPVAVPFTQGDVSGAHYLCEHKGVQVAIHPHADGCYLKNAAEGTHAAVLVDFGTELHGTLNVSVWTTSSPIGNKKSVDIRIRLGESIGEALTPIWQKNTTNDHATRDMVLNASFYSTNETPESGFRFAYIELLTPNAMLELRALQATLIVRDLPYRGSFQSSDEGVNRIFDTAAYTAHLCMQRYLWDGIKRDRLVWAGDMNTEIHTILSVFGACDVVPRSLDLMREITPAGGSMNTLSAYTLWWILSHYDWYMGTGDDAYLREQKDYLIETLERYYTYIGEDGVEKLPNGRLFDWPTEAKPDARHAGLQGLFRLSLLGASELLRYLGESERSIECLRHADRLLSHRPSPQGDKQVAAMLTLSGLGDPAEMVSGVILPGGPSGLSTFLGYFTLRAMAEAGAVTEALGIMRGYWGRMLELGATTFWEDFHTDWTKDNPTRIDEMPQPGRPDIHGDYGAFCYENYRHSLCHGWASGPAPFLSRHVLGVLPFAPGMRAVRFAPDLGDLDWARGTVPTPHGDISVELEKAPNGRTLRKIDAPDGVDVIVK